MQTVGCLECSLTHFLAKSIFFQRVWGMYMILMEIPEGMGGYFCGQKMEIPSMVGYGYFLEPHYRCMCHRIKYGF